MSDPNPFRESNPYQASTYAPVKSEQPSNRYPIAGLGSRLLGALIDGLISMIVLVPGYILMFVSIAASEGEPTPFILVGVAGVFFGFIGLLFCQVFLLVTRSQTVGKWMMQTKIMCVDTGLPAGPLKTLLLRSIVHGLIAGVPCIGGLYAIVDILFIFNEDRRCIHDQLAGTWVADVS